MIARRANASLAVDQWLISYMADECLARLELVRRDFPAALVFGRFTPGVALALEQRGTILTVVNSGIARSDVSHSVSFDEDRPPFADNSFDLVLAIGGLDTVNDLPGALLMIRRMLKRDGVFVGALAGAGSLSALRTAISKALPAAPRLHPQIELRALGDLMLRAGFSQPVTDIETISARYGSLVGLVRDLRANGMSSALPGQPPVSKSGLARLAAAFQEQAEDGKVTEQFSILHMTGWASRAR